MQARCCVQPFLATTVRQRIPPPHSTYLPAPASLTWVRFTRTGPGQLQGGSGSLEQARGGKLQGGGVRLARMGTGQLQVRGGEVHQLTLGLGCVHARSPSPCGLCPEVLGVASILRSLSAAYLMFERTRQTQRSAPGACLATSERACPTNYHESPKETRCTPSSGQHLKQTDASIVLS